MSIDEHVGIQNDHGVPNPGGYTPAGLTVIISHVGAMGLPRGWIDLFRESKSFTPFWATIVALFALLLSLAASGSKDLKQGRLATRATYGTAAFLHTLVHAAGVLTCTALAMVIADASADASWLICVVYVVALLVLGMCLGTLLFGLYLAVAACCFLNLNEAAAAGANQDWKNFVRLKVTDEAVTIYAYGIESTKEATGNAKLITTAEVRRVPAS